MADRPSLSDYIEVPERIQAFYKRYPEGSLQGAWEFVHVDERTLIVYRARAYRTPDDERPGVGTASEPFPGTTPYTRNSELMNAETSAWGRAIVALGITSNRKVASREEVAARQAEHDTGGVEGRPADQQHGRSQQPAAAGGLPQVTFSRLKQARVEAGLSGEQLRWHLIGVGVTDVPQQITNDWIRETLSARQAQELLDAFNAAIDQRAADGG